MKKFLLITLILTSAILVACNKNSDSASVAPTLDFKTGAGYTSDTITSAGTSTAIKVGISATQTSADDYLNTFTVSHNYDASVIIQDSSRVLSADEHKSFEEDVNFVTRSNPGVEVYYFTVTNQKGQVATKSITINVHQ